MKLKPYLIIVIVLTGILETVAQSHDQIPLKPKVGVTIMFEHINLPFQKRLGNKQHLGFVINYSLAKETDRLCQFEHNFNLGYFNHKNFFQAAFVNYKPSIGIKIANTFSINIPVGLGYAFSIPTQRSYLQVDGAFAKSKPKGKSHFMPSLGLGASFDLSEILGLPFDIFTQYEVFSLAPYAPKGSLPFTIHTSTNFGLKYRLK